MEIQYKISQKEYIKLMYFLVYKKPIMLLTLLMGAYLIYMDINIVISGKLPYLSISSILWNLSVLLGIFIFFPLWYYYKFRKSYQTNKAISSHIVSTFTDDEIQDTAETFKGELKWENIYKVEELKNWFLLYHSTTSFGICPKRVMNKNQILELRQMIIKKNIKAKLRND